MEVKRSVCRFCHSRCRIKVTSENGQLVKVEPDKTFPRWDVVFPPIKACPRLRGAKEFMYHPDRVNFPLKRVGEKGEGKWQQISWEQGLDEVAAKVMEIKDRYGPEAIGATIGTGRSWYKYLNRFLHLLGTPNVGGQNLICHGPAVVVAQAMYGWGVRHRTGVTIDTLGGKAVTKCVMLIGINPAHAFHRLWKSIREGKKLGVKLIVIDPRRTESAEMADLWLQQKPGSDAALLLSMIHVLIEQDLYDKEFVDKFVHGMGTEHLQGCIEAIQARFIMSALGGTVDSPGGDYIPGPSLLRDASEEELPYAISPEQKAKQFGADRFKLMTWPGRDLLSSYTKKLWNGRHFSEVGLTIGPNMPTLYRAILTGKPYPVRGMLTMFSNPMVTQANTKLVYKALKSLDLYVVHDYFVTPSAELADYVFPCASWLERPWLWDQYNEDCDI